MFLIILFSILSISIIAFSLYTGISPMPSSPLAKKIITQILEGDGKRIYELGSGWGGLAFQIASTYPQSLVHAFEISWLPWFFSLIKQKLLRRSNVRISRRNFFNSEFTTVDIVVCYLFPGAMKRLKSKFERELKPGTLVVSNTFAVPGWKPVKVITLNDLWGTKILVYKT